MSRQVPRVTWFHTGLAFHGFPCQLHDGILIPSQILQSRGVFEFPTVRRAPRLGIWVPCSKDAEAWLFRSKGEIVFTCFYNAFTPVPGLRWIHLPDNFQLFLIFLQERKCLTNSLSKCRVSPMHVQARANLLKTLKDAGQCLMDDLFTSMGCNERLPFISESNSWRKIAKWRAMLPWKGLNYFIVVPPNGHL